MRDNSCKFKRAEIIRQNEPIRIARHAIVFSMNSKQPARELSATLGIGLHDRENR